MFHGLGLEKSKAPNGPKSKDHDWWALSPFHPEKTASFHMGPGGVWYDLSVGEGGIRNAVSCLGSNLSVWQAEKLKELTEHLGVTRFKIVFDADNAGSTGAAKAAELIQEIGLEAEIFDWRAPIGTNADGPVTIPDTIQRSG